MDNPMEQTIESVVAEIFYSPATNNKAGQSISNGISLVQSLIDQQVKKALALNSEWNRVEDGLPDHWQEVNVYLSGNVVKIATFIINNGHKSFYCDITNGVSYSTVTHWQPLPQPPDSNESIPTKVELLTTIEQLQKENAKLRDQLNCKI